MAYRLRDQNESTALTLFATPSLPHLLLLRWLFTMQTIKTSLLAFFGVCAASSAACVDEPTDLALRVVPVDDPEPCPDGFMYELVCEEEGFRSLEVVPPTSEDCELVCVPARCQAGEGEGEVNLAFHYKRPMSSDPDKAVGIDDVGNIFVAGDHEVDNVNRIEVRSFNPAGELRWAFIEPLAGLSLFAIDVDAAGDVIVVGRHQIYKLSNDGDLLWSIEAPGGSGVGEPDVVVSPEGDIYFGGYFFNTIDFGLGPITAAGSFDAYLAKVSGDGQLLWQRTYGSPRQDYLNGVDLDADGNVVIVGTYVDPIDLGTGVLPDTGIIDAFAATLDSDGTTLWSRGYGGAGRDIFWDVSVDPAGDLVVAGSVGDGGGLFGDVFVPSAGANDMLLAKLDPGGDVVWIHSYGDAHDSLFHGVDTDPCGNILVAGMFRGNTLDPMSFATLDLGGGPMHSADSFYDVVAAKFDTSGAHVYSHRYGAEGNEVVSSIQAGLDGRAVFALGLNKDNVIDLGFGPIDATWYNQVAIVGLTP